MKVRDENGSELDATFSVEVTPTGPAIVYESRGGTRGKKTQRNADYAPGLDALLSRLKARAAVIRQVRLHQKGEDAGNGLEPERYPMPIHLANVSDVLELRKAIGASAAKTNRSARAITSGSSGNSTKRIRIYLDGIEGTDPERLQRELAGLAAGTAPVAERPDPQLALEVLAELNGAQEQKRQRRGDGQGYGLSKAERDAVEDFAMKKATEHFSGMGWKVENVSNRESYDLACKRDGEELRVEVKGTTGRGDTILLTKNEVAHAHERYPNVALYVLSGIKLTKGTAPKCSGGKARAYMPWKLDDAALVAIGFQYGLT